ncbi:hypothetical protein ABT158_19870 [Nonomuraea sp. NPDC001636]|uniref:hypothetical protein n=1 Tax=Nonomuraea sp. NPDC001636 TaxID=3154391 RepID=UPI00332508CE
MLRKFVPAAVAAVSLAGLAFASPAGAETLSSYKAYGCASGDFCVYSTEVISEATKISIGRGENWGPVSVGSSPYKGVRSFFNNGKIDTYDHVWVSYYYGDGTKASKCIHRAEDGDLSAGHEWPDRRMPVTVVQIQWKKENCAD